MTVKCSRANSTEIFVRWMFLIQSYLGGRSQWPFASRVANYHSPMLGAPAFQNMPVERRGNPRNRRAAVGQPRLPVRLRGKISREHPVSGPASIQQTLRMEIPAQIIRPYGNVFRPPGRESRVRPPWRRNENVRKKLILRVQGHARFFNRLGQSRVRKASFISQGLGGGKQR